ncbi:MAG: 5-(carboxyamino)imidazole ribonucleotide mutase [Elusimicrobiota bacterium]
MGSRSDLEVMEPAVKTLKELDIPCEVRILSAHRAPELLMEYMRTCRRRGIKVLIGGAGGAAALPGMMAAFTTLPVIGVPVRSKSLQGLDSLLSIAQMPSGVPVATVGIDNSKNAALLAARILAVEDKALALKLEGLRAAGVEKARSEQQA